MHPERLVGRRSSAIVAPVLLGTVFLGGCVQRSELAIPSTEEVEAHYASETALEAEVRGNLAVITVVQPAAQLRRGGSMWAKVGPYIYLFSEETRSLFADFPGLAGVRVMTKTAGGVDVANAMLIRDELSGVQWRRALNIAGQARRDGTERPSLLEALIRWGEDHAEHEYSPRFTARH